MPRSRTPGRAGGAPAGVGLLTGLTSLLVVLAPVVLAWLVEPLATGDGWQAAGTGAALWLLVSGAHLATGEVTLSLVPLLGTAALARRWPGSARARRWSTCPPTVSTGGARCRARSPPRSVPGGRGMPLAVAVAVGLTVAGPFRVTPLSLVLPVVVLPLLALVLALRPVAADDPDVLGRAARARLGARHRAPRGATGPARRRACCSVPGWSSSSRRSPCRGTR